MIRKLLSVIAIVAIGVYAYAGNMQCAEAQGMDIAIGTSGLDFELTDLEKNKHKLSDYFADGKVVVLEWYNPGCPFVKKYYEGGNTSMLDAKAFAEKNGVVWLAVNSGAEGMQGYGLDHNKEFAAKWGIKNPILLDESGKAGRDFGAANTPQLLVFSEEGVLLYNGGVDETKMADEAPQNNFVINALTQHMAGKKVDPASTAHIGCSVKYAK
jgi:thiol-disulfide isomerase/thioredoxin